MITTTDYWLAASLAGALFLAAAAWEKIHRGVYVLAIGAALLAFRWPVVCTNSGLGVDEDFMLAGAMTLTRFYKFWVFSDGVTHGPLNQYPLALLGLLGFRLDYITARLFGLAMVWGALAGAYLMLRDVLDEVQARLAVLPALVFFALVQLGDFLYYTTEHAAICLLSLGGHACWHGASARRNRLIFLGALLLGCVPWAKMQGGPVAALMSLGGLAAALVSRNPPGDKRKMALCWLAGSLAPTLVILLLVTGWGAWPDFSCSLKLLTTYREAGMFPDFQYPNPARVLGKLFLADFAHPQFKAYWMPLLATALLALPFFLKKPAIRITAAADARAGRADFTRRRASMTREGAWFARVLATVLGALVSISAAGNAFWHYLLFAIVPVCVLAAACFFRGPAPLVTKFQKEPVTAILLFLCATITPQIAVRATLSSPFLPFDKSRATLREGFAAAVINKYSRPGDTLAIWGWYDELPVETRLPLATRASNISAALVPACQQFIIERFVSDMTARRPRFFVDAVGPGRFYFTNRRAGGHEVIPALRRLIATHYTLLADTEGARVYVARPAPEKPY